jgi:hypothetical protein
LFSGEVVAHVLGGTTMIFIEIPENINNRKGIRVYRAKSIDSATAKDEIGPEKVYQFPRQYAEAGGKIKKQDITITQANMICVQAGSKLWRA